MPFFFFFFLARVSGISYLQGIPQIFTWFSSLTVGRASQGLSHSTSEGLPVLSSVFVAPLEHYCLNLISLALRIKSSFSICLYLAPSSPYESPCPLQLQATAHSTMPSTPCAVHYSRSLDVSFINESCALILKILTRFTSQCFLPHSGCHMVISKIKGTIFTRIV